MRAFFVEEKKLISKKFSNACLILIPVAFIALMLAQSQSHGPHTDQLNGIIQALGFDLCLLLTVIEYKKGTIIGLFLLLLSVIRNVIVIITIHNMGPLPGVVNSLTCIIIIAILYWQFDRQDKLSKTDFVTKLINRRGLYLFGEKRVKNSDPFALSIIYVDNFKLLNDNHGREYGDSILKHVADVAKEVVGNSGIVFRMGGPEFVIYINDITNAELLVTKIVDKLAEEYIYKAEDSTTIANYLSIFSGVSKFPEDSDDFDQLITFADMAMLHAEKARKERICWFNKDMEDRAHDDLTLEKLVEQGLEYDYFFMMYQPQYMMDGKTVRGFESLIRMRTPEGQLVSPGRFIPVAERSDLIMKLDYYVLRKVMTEFGDTCRNANNKFVMSVNISAKNICNIGFADKVLKIVSELNFPADCLEIEITEYCMAKSVDIAIENIEKLKSSGIKIALDDFGTGYTSLHYLAKLPIDLLKIDKTLIDDITNNEKSKDFVKAVISLGHIMGCEVISEGVEDENQVSIIKDYSCDFVQGFVWSKPISFDDALSKIK